MGRTEEFTAATFRFDAFELDGQRRTLRRSGADVELRPLAFDALAFLVRHAGHLVTKDELIAAVWPGLVVTDDSIARCISDIRRALGVRCNLFAKQFERAPTHIFEMHSIGAQCSLFVVVNRN